MPAGHWGVANTKQLEEELQQQSQQIHQKQEGEKVGTAELTDPSLSELQTPQGRNQLEMNGREGVEDKERLTRKKKGMTTK